MLGGTGKTGRRVVGQLYEEEFASVLARHAVPHEYVNFLTQPFTEVLDGRNAHLTDGVQRALGRQPRDFAAYARATAATGVWEA